MLAAIHFAVLLVAIIMTKLRIWCKSCDSTASSTDTLQCIYTRSPVRCCCSEGSRNVVTCADGSLGQCLVHRIHINYVLLVCAVLCLWPVVILVGMTVLGSVGAGFQTRFLLPILPATAILAGVPMALSSQNSISLLLGLFFLCYMCLHTLYYGVLFSPLFADLDHSLLDILKIILSHPYYKPPDKDSFIGILNFVRHFGLDRQIR